VPLLVLKLLDNRKKAVGNSFGMQPVCAQLNVEGPTGTLLFAWLSLFGKLVVQH